jgi:hypothetical protein
MIRRLTDSTTNRLLVETAKHLWFLARPFFTREERILKILFRRHLRRRWVRIARAGLDLWD